MESTSVTDQQLNAILSAGSNAVLNIYQRFRRQFPDQPMREVGLTDIFMVEAQETAQKVKKDVKFKWSTNESLTGSDFEVVANNGTVRLFFQAKVAKGSGSAVYSDFLYESKRKVNEETVLEYQNLLLADSAIKHGAHAYYVIYDDKAVWWVNAIALKNWFNDSGVKEPSNVKICVRAFKELAKTSFLDVMNNPQLHK